MNIERLFIIDRCLHDENRQWSLQDLIDQCGEAMQNSKRSVQADLETLRKRFGAKIMVVDKKFYTYRDKNYNLAEHILCADDKQHIAELLTDIRQYTRFNEMHVFENDILRLHDKIAAAFGLPRPSRHLPGSVLEAQDIRLWICEDMVDKIIKRPIHPTQKIEQYEIDGSANIVIHTVMTAKLEKWINEQEAKHHVKLHNVN